MRNCFFYSIICLLCCFPLVCGNAFAQENSFKYGVVDIAKLMRDSKPGKDGIKFIEGQQAEMQKKLDEIQAKLEKNPKDQALMQELQKVFAASQQKIQGDGQNVANLIYDTVVKVMNKFRTDNGYDILFGAETIASYNSATDVTEAVLKEVDKEKLEFKPLPMPEIKTAPPAVPEKAPAPQEDKAAKKDK